jgi:ketosteroid isomerase-like protein
MSREDELVRLEHDWQDALRRRDMDFLEELLGDEFTLTTGRPTAPVRTRQEWLDISRDRYAVESFEFEDIDVHVYGDAALVRSRYTQRGSMDGEDRTQPFLMTDVFVMRDGRWRAVTRHISPL